MAGVHTLDRSFLAPSLPPRQVPLLALVPLVQHGARLDTHAGDQGQAVEGGSLTHRTLLLGGVWF